MKIIDTSCWVECFRRDGDAKTKKRVTELILEDEAGFSCPVFFEIISGAKEHEMKDIISTFDTCRRFQLIADDWDKAAEWNQTLRRKGMTLPVIDLLIGVMAVRLELPVMCKDKHYDIIWKTFKISAPLEQLD